MEAVHHMRVHEQESSLTYYACSCGVCSKPMDRSRIIEHAEAHADAVCDRGGVATLSLTGTANIDAGYTPRT